MRIWEREQTLGSSANGLSNSSPVVKTCNPEFAMAEVRIEKREGSAMDAIATSIVDFGGGSSTAPNGMVGLQ